MSEENKNYEIGFLVKAELDREELVKRLKESQFSVINDGQISRIKLAYPIKKESFAYFGHLCFSGEPANIQNLISRLKTESEILRFSIIPQSPEENKGGISKEIYSTQARHFSERQRVQEIQPTKVEALSNEALEKKLKEILK